MNGSMRWVYWIVLAGFLAAAPGRLVAEESEGGGEKSLSEAMMLDVLDDNDDVQRVAPQPGAEFLEFQLVAACLAADGVVVIPGFLTDEKDRFKFLFALCHRST